MNNSTAKAKPKMTVKNGVVYGDALSAQEKKRIVMQKKKDRKAKKVRKSAQQTIPYVEMCRDGICKVNSRLYTKSMMQLNVYLFMTLRQSRLSGSSTNQKSTPMKTSELRIDSGVSFRGKSVEFAPKIT